MDFVIKDGVLKRSARKYAEPDIVVPEGVREIGDRAFYGVVYVGTAAFAR